MGMGSFARLGIVWLQGFLCLVSLLLCQSAVATKLIVSPCDTLFILYISSFLSIVHQQYQQLKHK